jgi:hypothetical protein
MLLAALGLTEAKDACEEFVMSFHFPSANVTPYTQSSLTAQVTSGSNPTELHYLLIFNRPLNSRKI